VLRFAPQRKTEPRQTLDERALQFIVVERVKLAGRANLASLDPPRSSCALAAVSDHSGLSANSAGVLNAQSWRLIIVWLEARFPASLRIAPNWRGFVRALDEAWS
jgi:hypothetical protein